MHDIPKSGAENAAAAADAHTLSSARDSILQGQTTLLPLLDLFDLLRTRSTTGVLRVKQESRQSVVYLRRGDIVMASHNQPHVYIKQSPSNLSAISDADKKRAMDIQIETLKPVFVTWAESGSFPSADLPRLLRHHGQDVLLEMLEGGPGQFSLLQCDPLPDFAEAHGTPLSQEQLKLSRLRRVDDWAQVELRVGRLDMIFWRADCFSRKLLQLDLNDVERRVLTLVDGRNRVSTIIERAAASPFEVFHALYCMSQLGLIRKDRRARDGSETGALQAISVRPIFILEPDLSGTLQPLEKALRHRHPHPTVNLNDEPNLVERMVRETPQLVLMNASAVDAEKLAREIRARIEISDTTLAAILDKADAGRHDALRAAGFNVVWVKPFLLRDIELLLAS